MSTKSDGQVVIEIVGDDSALSKSLNEASNKSERFGKELQRVNELLKLDPKNITLVEQKQKLLTDEVEATKEKLELLRQAEQEVQAQFEKGKVTEEHYRAVQREIVSTEQALEKLTKEQSDFQKKLDDSEESAKKFTASAEEMDKQMVTMSATCSALVVTLIAIGAQAVQAAMEFDSAFAKTQTIMDQNVVSAKQMRSEIMALSKSSGMSAGNVSEAVYQAISGSVATEDATAFVEQANKLAVSGFTSLSNATDVLTTSLNAYGLSADKVGGISNVLIQTQNLGKTSVDELASSMGKAISTGSAYGVNLENLSTAYVELTRGGIDTAEATTYISAMLNELGDAGSNVGGILQEKTGKSFGQLMADGWSLGDVLQVLSDTVDGDAEALMGLWSSQEAGKASNAIMTQSVEDFNAVCAQMQQEMAGTTGTTEKAYKTMTNTSEFIDQRLNNSINNLGIAFGDNLSPAVDGAKKLLTGIVEGVTTVVEKYPAVSAVLTGLAFGLGALAIVLTTYTLKTKLAKNETLKLTAAMLKNPVTLVIAGLTAAAVGIATYAAKTGEANEETEKLSATSELQRRELEDLKAEYAEVCKTMGETSAEAQILKEKLDDETETFEKNKKTAKEVQEELRKTHDAYTEMEKQYNDQISGIEDEYEGTIELINRLNELTEAEYQSAAAKEEILSIVEILNERIPELGLNYDALAGKVNMSPEEIIEAAEYANNESTRNTNWETLKERTSNVTKLDNAAKTAKTEYETAYEELEKAWESFYKYADDQFRDGRQTLFNDMKEAGYDPDEFELNDGELLDWIEDRLPENQAASASFNKLNKAVENYNTKKGTYDSAQDDYETNESEIIRLANELGDAQEETGMLAGEMEAMTSITDGLISSMEELATAYNEAYEAAYDSISGQYALWDDVAKVSAMSVKKVTESMQAQTEYWKNYDANLQTLLLYAPQIEGLSEMIAANADGSADSVNLIAGVAKSLSEGDIKAVEGMVLSWQELQTQQEKTAGSISEMKTGIDDEMQEIISNFEKNVEELDFSDASMNAAIDTINAYIEGAEGLLPEVSRIFSEIGESAYMALTTNVSANEEPTHLLPKEKLHTYASGTHYAQSGLALVGEAGPELVYLRGGERILTADETRSILNTVYPVAPQMQAVGVGAPSITGKGSVQIRATIAVPVSVDGREFARATAEYMGEEMEFEVM